MAFPDHLVPVNHDPAADKPFTDRWENWRTGAGLDLALESDFSAIL